MKKTVLLLLAVCFIAYGCSENQDKTEERVIKNIVAVYWHEYNFYSFAVEHEDSSISMESFGKYACSQGNIVKLFHDVPNEEKMWAKAEIGTGHCDLIKSLAIHLHSIEDINGAEWDNGKFGSGTTIRVN